MSSDEEELKLYSALERNKKRQMFGASASPVDALSGDTQIVVNCAVECDDTGDRLGLTMLRFVGRRLLDGSDDDDDDLFTPSEREAERLRKLRMEQEIRKKLEKDKVLNQTRDILKKVSSTKRQTTVNNLEVISLDSDSDDEDDVGSAAPAPVKPVAPPQTPVDKGSRIVLHIRSNGGAVDEIGIHKVSKGMRILWLLGREPDVFWHLQKESFGQLYTSFCELHGLPRSAVKMSLDGEALSLTSTPMDEDLDSGDLIDAKVDFSKQVEFKKKTYLRLRLVLFGRRSETFKIDSVRLQLVMCFFRQFFSHLSCGFMQTATVAKLHASYCQRHGITNPYDVVMSVQDQELRLKERLDYYGLIDQDEISVKVYTTVAPQPTVQTIAVQLRFDEGDPETYHIVPVR
ncbi:unnamed protein product [Phytophthora lilii]|uniref:Unnamed protein product n=1 Tax=Phytophthora lilii TaxID=2077276 RepID=A0A9W6TRQ3_9STRA|nr:unnamed protein product [Phytophthora lilii]